jgi:short-chain Z-isoprenyl diphosphate synthase
MPIRSIVRRGYARWLRRRLATATLPRHVALVIDGNRRWAPKQGYEDPRVGHRSGAAHIESVLSWCAELGIDRATVWVASVNNIRRRDPAEVAFLMHLAETVIADRLAAGGRWRVHLAGRLDLLPDSTTHALKEAVETTASLGDAGDLTIAIGYSGREEFVGAIRNLLRDADAERRSLSDVAAELSEADIARYLEIADEPYPDLVIRTSGEQRLSDFLLWQAVDSELYFVDAYWPAFRQIDLLRALRSFVMRRR